MAAVLFTGGKDSSYAIKKLRASGYEISCLVSVISENPDSYMLHTPNIEITRLAAEALEIPIEFGFTKGEKEEELVDIRDSVLSARKKFSFDFIGSGGLSSEYQRSRLQKIADEIGISSLAPLWGIDQKQYLRTLVSEEFNFILTSVSAAGLDDRWLGKVIDEIAAEELLSLAGKYRFNAAFEGGEAETLVLDCPLFLKKKMEILESEKFWDGSRGRLVIKKVRLTYKQSQESSVATSTDLNESSNTG
jgi:diphthine-ammonia ligase